MAGLFKYFKRQEKPTNFGSLLTRNEVEEANKAVAKVRIYFRKGIGGKYNSYTPVQRAKIGNHAAENGAMNAVKHFPECCEA